VWSAPANARTAAQSSNLRMVQNSTSSSPVSRRVSMVGNPAMPRITTPVAWAFRGPLAFFGVGPAGPAVPDAQNHRELLAGSGTRLPSLCGAPLT
jgi:hypothetical protein